MAASSSPHNRISKAAAFFIIVAAVICAAYFFIVLVPEMAGNKAYDLIKRVAKDIDQVIHFVPKITEGEKEVILETKPIAEFSPVQREFEHSYTWSHTWLGSTKSMTIKARFIVKAGYDLTKPFSVDFSKDQKVVRIQFPPAKVNSCVGSKYVTVTEDGGWWNGITKDERDAVINELNARAEKSAIDNGILKEAEKHLKSQVEETIHKAAPGVTIAPHPFS